MASVKISVSKIISTRHTASLSLNQSLPCTPHLHWYFLCSFSGETPPTLSQLSHNLSLSSFGSASISLIRQSSSSLDARFLPRSSIGTHAVLICDDDVEMDQKSLEFAFRVWQSNTDRLIGVFARSHDIDLVNKDWIYTVHPDKYSIVLTKLMILKSSYLLEYSCGGGSGMSEMLKMVDEMPNCEDILMNFVVADVVYAGPIMMGSERESEGLGRWEEW